jgi:predicted metal-dependent hydrolase
MEDMDSGPVTVEYKRIKNLRMTVYPPDGRLRIAAPLGTPAETIRNFIRSKEGWIEGRRAKYRRNAAAKNRLQDREIHVVWGTPYRLELAERRGRSGVALEDGVMRLSIPPGATKAKKQEILDRWYRKLAGQAAPPLVKKWEPLIGAAVRKVFYRKMKSHWGSCNCAARTIRLNTELAKKPPQCLDYVILHEMAHLLESAHNQAFYALMNRLMPSWKIIRKKMNSGEI